MFATSIKTRFDGQKIEVPPELVGREPCEVEIVVKLSKQEMLEATGDGIVKDMGPRSGSIWDLIGTNPNPLTDEQLRERLAELRRDRDEWDDD